MDRKIEANRNRICKSDDIIQYIDIDKNNNKDNDDNWRDIDRWIYEYRRRAIALPGT